MLTNWLLRFPKTEPSSHFNRGDFVQLHTDYLEKNLTHSGIIVSDQLEIGVVIRRLLKLLDGRSAGDMHNWLEFLSNWR
jgi:hypothetical protein